MESSHGGVIRFRFEDDPKNYEELSEIVIAVTSSSIRSSSSSSGRLRSSNNSLQVEMEVAIIAGTKVFTVNNIGPKSKQMI